MCTLRYHICLVFIPFITSTFHYSFFHLFFSHTHVLFSFLSSINEENHIFFYSFLLSVITFRSRLPSFLSSFLLFCFSLPGRFSHSLLSHLRLIFSSLPSHFPCVFYSPFFPMRVSSMLCPRAGVQHATRATRRL